MSPAKKGHGGRRTPLEMLTRSHQRIDGVLSELSTALANDDSDGVDEALAFLRGPYGRHVADEEESIFPRLGPAHRETIASLIAEHRAQQTLIEQLRAAWHRGDTPAATSLFERLRKDLARHSQVEEKQLWPAIAALGDPEISAAHAEMRGRRHRR